MYVHFAALGFLSITTVIIITVEFRLDVRYVWKCAVCIFVWNEESALGQSMTRCSSLCYFVSQVINK